jgi:CRP-like cAMP-binding protein
MTHPKIITAKGSYMPACYLTFDLTPGHKTIFPILETTTLGRSEDNDIILSDPAISRNHARIIFENGNWETEDLGSANGIIVHGSRISKAVLQSGDFYKIGKTTFRFIGENAFEPSDQLFRTAEILSASFNDLALIAEKERSKTLSHRLREGITAVPFLSSLWEEELRKLADAATLHVFGDGKTIISQGDPGRSIYIVLAGRVRVFVRDHYSRAHELATLEVGDFFGEMSFFTGEPRSANVAAIVTSWIIELSAASLKKLIEEHPPVKKVLVKYYSDRLKDTKKKLSQKEVLERGKLARLKKRFPVNLMVTSQAKKEVENRRIFFKGSSLDMSLAGIDVMLATKYSEQLDPQMKVNLEIVLPSPWGLIRAEGQVNQMKPAHVRRKPTLVSIEFVSMEEKETKKLKEFLYGDTNEVH